MQKALNVLKLLSHSDWGGDKKTLLNVYRSLIRSKLDYGCIIYGSAGKSYLKKLDTIHHQGLWELSVRHLSKGYIQRPKSHPCMTEGKNYPYSMLLSWLQIQTILFTMTLLIHQSTVSK